LVKILSKLGNNEDEIIEILEKLKDIDIFRKEYYLDFGIYIFYIYIFLTNYYNNYIYIY